ncbi:MAG: mechanosensitive ion channel family protein [Sphingobium sp.]
MAAAAPDSARYYAQQAEAAALAELQQPAGAYSYEKINALNALRKRVARNRDLAKSIADRGTLQTRLLKAQLDALGPSPDDGKTELGAIASRRTELDNRLSAAMTPVLYWQEEAARSAALVLEIDERIHALDRTHKMTPAQSPLNPAPWLKLTNDIRNGKAFTFPVETANTNGLPLPMRYLVGLFFFFAVPVGIYLFWSWLGRRLNRRIRQAASPFARLAITLLQDALSVLLFVLVSASALTALAAMLSPFMGMEARLQLCASLFAAGLIVAVAHWLGRSALLSPIEELRLIRFQREAAVSAFRVVRSIGIVLAAVAIFQELEEAAMISVALSNLGSSLLVIAGSLLIWRLAGFIASAPREPVANLRSVNQPVNDEQPAINFSRPISSALKLLALAAVATALSGYITLAREIFSDLLLSLAVVAIALYFHRTVTLILFALADGPLRAYRRTLRFLPMATGLAILFAVLFLIALTWGYRLQEIGDAIIALRTGVEFGDIRISAGDVFTFALVFAVGYFVTRWTQRFLRASILPEFEIDRGGSAAIVTGIGYAGIILAALIAIAATGLDLSSLAFVAGALSVGLGFGLQSVIENFTSGIILLVERPIKEGDWVEVGEFSGIVRKIAVRSTQLETFDGHHIIIPNSELVTDSVKNLSFGGGQARIIVPVGVSYASDVDRVRALLVEIADDNPKVVKYPEPFVTLAEFGESSIDFKLFCFVADVMVSAGTVSELNFEIAHRFAREEIEIPFPQRDIHIRRDASQ